MPRPSAERQRRIGVPSQSGSTSNGRWGTFLAPVPMRTPMPGREPTFSVVIAAYNAAATLSDAIESVLAQTRPAQQVIVVDDGSTDGTRTVLERYASRLTSIQRRNGGVASARNAALADVTGEYVAVLDADDIFLPERLDALHALASARPDLDILCTDAFLEVDGQVVATFGEGCPFDVADQRRAILHRCFCIAPAYRRDILIRSGGFDESLGTGEDWECVIRLVHAGSLAGAVDEPLYRYRLHAGSLTSDRASTLRDRVILLEDAETRLALTDGERRALKRSLAAQRAKLALTEAEAALRGRSSDARRRALTAATTRDVGIATRLGALAAAVAPATAARALERRDAHHGRTRLRRTFQRPR